MQRRHRLQQLRDRYDRFSREANALGAVGNNRVAPIEPLGKVLAEGWATITADFADWGAFVSSGQIVTLLKQTARCGR